MAVQRFKLPLNNAAFPFISKEAPRAVFVPGLDVAPRTPRGFVASGASADYDLTQIIYGENFMPVGSGVRSVGYEQIISATANNDFDSIFPLRDDDDNVVLYSPGGGKNYTYNSATFTWSSTTIPTIYSKTFSAGSDPTTSRVTYAFVEGMMFVCFSRLKSNDATPVDMSLLYWNPVTKAFVPASSLITELDNGPTTPQFAAGTIDGIAAAAGYLLMWSGFEIAWAPVSSAGVFNFNSVQNAAISGADSRIPEDLKGPVRALVPLPGGFVAFTSRNAVGFSYVAKNLAEPWIVREIPDAGGIANFERATVEGSLGKVIAYTTAGMQSVSMNSAEIIHPDLGDFIASREIEYYNSTTRVLTQAAVSLDLYVKVTAVGNRYLVISYGTTDENFEYALVYDIAIQRWGKLAYNHVDCFYYNYGAYTADPTYSMLQGTPYSALPESALPATSYQDLTALSTDLVSAPHGLAFLSSTGKVVLADWSNQERITDDNGVIIIGRTQLSRSRFTQLNRVELEGMKTGDVYVVPSYDGRNLATAEALITITAEDDYRDYGGLVDCKNFNIIISGTFDLSTVLLEATPTGAL